ncbi:MAG: hypothetical protein ACPH3M_09440 [Candidatus Puniceispirillales bacterium]
MMTTVDLSYQIRPQSPHDEQDICLLMGLGFAPSHGAFNFQERAGPVV